MQLIILGYGKMGRAVQEAAGLENIDVRAVLDEKNDLNTFIFKPGDVVIDFTTASAFLKNIPVLMQKKIPVICGTTGWYDRMGDIQKIVSENAGTFLYASNFSIAVHLFWRIVGFATKQMEGIADMDVFVRDIHHRMKADSPSGTALTTARVILDHSTRKKQILTDEKQPPQLDQLQISSARGGYIFGEHEVTFDSPQDTLQIIHTAKSRMGFAKGSLAAARWVSGKTGFFTIDDYLNDM